MKEIREVDLRNPDPARSAEGKRTLDLVFRINQTNPDDPGLQELLEELFVSGYGEGTKLVPPLYVNLAQNITIGSHVSIQPYFRAMSAGKIVIEDGTMIAMNVSVITNNHDMYQRQILTVSDVHIGRHAWIGSGAILLPGVTIGDYAVVGAGSVVTRDVPDYCVAAGNPAKIMRRLDPDQFEPAPWEIGS